MLYHMSDLADLVPSGEPNTGDDLSVNSNVDVVRKQWAKFQDDVKLTLDNLWVKHVPGRFRKPDQSLRDANSIDDARSRWSVRSTLDLYARFSLTKPLRLRAKTSLYPMRYVAVKGEASGSVGIAPDISLEIKLLDVLKYHMRGGNSTAGNSAQLRIRTPLKLKGAEMDVIYERHSLLSPPLSGQRDGVRVAFRFADAAYLKVPNAKVALKSQSRILKPLKTTLRIKRALEPPPPPPATTANNREGGELSALERLDRVGNILLGRRPTDGVNSTNNTNSVPSRTGNSAASRPPARKRPDRSVQESVQVASGEKGNLFQAARNFLTGQLKADDVGFDVKYRWIDTRG